VLALFPYQFGPAGMSFIIYSLPPPQLLLFQKWPVRKTDRQTGRQLFGGREKRAALSRAQLVLESVQVCDETSIQQNVYIGLFFWPHWTAGHGNDTIRLGQGPG
jgi:hypothetical protein